MNKPNIESVCTFMEQQLAALQLVIEASERECMTDTNAAVQFAGRYNEVFLPALYGVFETMDDIIEMARDAVEQANE